MSTEDTRNIILQWIDLVQNRRFADLTTLATPDATWWLSGPSDNPKVPFSGFKTYAERANQAQEDFKGVPSIDITVHDLTVEGDTGVLEYSPHVDLGGGQRYDNDVLMKFVVKDGKIVSVREFLDLGALFKARGVNLYAGL